MSNAIVIDGQTFNVPYVVLKREATALDKYARRTMDGVLHRQLIGVFVNYQITFGTFTDMELYNRLWNILTQPVEFHTIKLPSHMGSATFEAYISSVNDEFKYIDNEDGVRIMAGLSAKFTAKAPNQNKFGG